MEVKRLHIGGLHPEVTESELLERFSKFGSIDGVQIKVRKGFDDAPSKAFAYLNIKATEADIKKCMKVFDKTKWKGYELRIQPAKENFLSRLEKERTIPGEAEEKVTDEEMPSPKKPFEMEVKGPPGTKVPGMEDWVVGKYGRILPVVNLKKDGTKYPKKIDPSKYVHKVKRFDTEREEVTEGAPNLLTWELKEIVDEITQKRKGDFKEWKPKTKQRKTELNYTLEDVLKKTSAKYIFAEENHGDFEIVNPDKDPTSADKTVLEPPSVDLSRFASDSESDDENRNKMLLPVNKNLTTMKVTKKPSDKKQSGVLLKEFKGIGNLSNTAVVDSSVKSTDKQKDKKVEGKKVKSKDSALPNALDSKKVKSKDGALPNALDSKKVKSKDSVKVNAPDSRKVKSADNAKTSAVLVSDKSNKTPLVPPNKSVNMGQLNTLSEFASGVSLSFHMKKPATSNSDDEINDNLSFSDQSEAEDVEPDSYDPFSIFKFGVNKSRNVLNKNITKGSEKPGGNINSNEMNGTEEAVDMDENEEDENLLDDCDKVVKSDSSSSDDESDDGVKLTDKDEVLVKNSSSDDDLSEDDSDDEDDDKDTVVNKNSKLTDNLRTAENDSESESDDAEGVVKNESVSKDILVNDISSESEESNGDDHGDLSKNVTKSERKTAQESDSSDSESSVSDDENNVIKSVTLATEKPRQESDSSGSESSNSDTDDNHVRKNITKAAKNTSKDSDSSEIESIDSDADDDNHVSKNITKATQSTSKVSDSSETESSDSDSEHESLIMQSTKNTSNAAARKTLDLKADNGSNILKKKVDTKLNAKKKEDLVGTTAVGKSLNPEDVERHRLEAVKQKHQDNLKQAATVKNALANINKGSALNKKVVFDDSDEDDDNDGSTPQVSLAKKMKDKSSLPGVGDHSSSGKSSQKVTEFEKKPALFDSSSSSDDESSDDEEDRFAIRPQFEGSSGSKLLELQASYGNDKRFQLDERFADDDSDEDSSDREAINESEEKQNALKILESVVGHKITTDTSEKKKSKSTFKDMKSLHYDPTSTAHTDMDLTKEQISQKNKKSKKETEAEKSQKSNMEGETPIETTQERFIEVSESFKDVFANKDKSDGGQTFSLLQAFGVQGVDHEDGVGAEDDAENSLLPDKDKLPLDARFVETDDKDADRETEPMDTDQAEIDVSAAVKEAPLSNKKKGKKQRDHVNFFFKEGDERLDAGTKFFRTENLEEIREKWRKEKQDHIQRFKLKAKNFTRKMKKQPGQRGDGRQVDRPLKDIKIHQKSRQTTGHRQTYEYKRGRRE